MQAFLISTLIVAIGEIGDKTQLLALILAARFRRPAPILLGILVATLANHAAAGLLGQWIRVSLDPQYLRWGLSAAFFGMAGWALMPDTMEDDPRPVGRYGVFAVTVVTFFLAEMGDKTQFATVMLAARFPDLVAVVAGTTCGMMLADAPAVLLANAASNRIPFRLVRLLAAVLFAGLGLATLLGWIG